MLLPKVYFHDCGLHIILLGQFNPIERTADGHEIDFVIDPASGPGSAIEIKFDEENFNPKKYNNFLDAYPEYSITCRAFRTSGNANSLMAL